MTAPDTAIARRAFKQIWVSATVWAAVFGASAAASALSYVNSFPTAASRQQIAETTGKDAGFAVLLGPVSAIGTVGGYTVYKCFLFLTSIGAIWAILATTRLLRGEEDAGRWQLVLAGNTRAPRAAGATLVALGAAVTVIFAGTTLLMLLAGRSPKVGIGSGETVLYGLSVVVAPAVFIGVAAVTSQLGRTRRMASGLGIGVFGVMFALRMIADSGPHARWLLWLTPFGWTERMRPLTANDAWPLLPAVVTVLVLCVAATVLSARRDVGDGLIASSDVAPLRPFGLRSPSGLALRLELPVLGAWCVGAAVAAFAFGVIAKVAAGNLPASFGDALAKFGVQGRFVNQYLGVTFLFVATVVALLPASQIGAAAEEETSGRIVHLLSRPTKRATVFGGRLAICAAAIVAAAVLTGLAAWAGAQSQGVNAGLGRLLGAGLNVIPTAFLALGIGALVLALAPRAAVRTVYAVVLGSLLVDVIGSTVSGLRRLEHVSLFHYMALAPAQDPDPRAVTITIAVSAALCVLATLAFARRDLQPG